jgi:CHAD domain-containing protein
MEASLTPLRWNASKPVAENAKEKLPELAGMFFRAGAEVAEEQTPIAAIHHFRLLTKRFRYTLELFADYYGPGLKRHIETLKSLQQLLGEVSDCSATQNLLAKRKDLTPSEHTRLQRKLNGLARVRAAKFRREWLKNFSPSHARTWTNYLGR